jgi:poly(rC)-binding protein 2/3/4
MSRWQWICPNSTEWAITIADFLQSIIDCVKQICGGHDGDPQPRKNVNIQYWPKPSSSPVIFAGGQDRFTEQAVIVRAFPTPPLEVVPSGQGP